MRYYDTYARTWRKGLFINILFSIYHQHWQQIQMKAKYYYISISIKYIEIFRYIDHIVLYLQSRSEYEYQSENGDGIIAWFRI